MSSALGQHGSDHSEVVSLYALHALPSSGLPGAEAQIAACAECRQELETLRPIADALPVDVLRPSTTLWPRLAQRIAAEPAREPLGAAPPPWVEPEWVDVAPGISCKLLATDTQTNRVSMLVRLSPGTDYPPHRHSGVEEVHMLDGELIVDDATLLPGDYRRADPDSADRRVWSETGCTCLLITSFHDAIL